MTTCEVSNAVADLAMQAASLKQVSTGRFRTWLCHTVFSSQGIPVPRDAPSCTCLLGPLSRVIKFENESQAKSMRFKELNHSKTTVEEEYVIAKMCACGAW